MKITFVTHILTTSPGGAQRQLCLIADGLAERGYDVSIAVHEGARNDCPYPLDARVRIDHICPAVSERELARRLLIDPARSLVQRAARRIGLDGTRAVGKLLWLDRHDPFRRRLEAYLAAHRPAVAIAFMDWSVIALARSAPGYPVIRIGSNRNNPQLSYDTRTGERANPFHYAINRAALSDMDRLVTQLPDFLAWYPLHLRDRLRVISNIILPPAATRPWTGESRSVIAVGRLVALKRFHLLVEAWHRAGPAVAGWSLEIFGYGPEASRLAARIQALGLGEAVTLHGHVEDLSEHYEKAALLVHPAEGEGFPNGVAEALIRGRPVMGFTDCAGLNSLVLDGVNGFLVPASDDRAGALANSLCNALAAPAKLQEMYEACTNSMRAYGAERITDEWEQMLRELTEPGSRM